MQPNYMKIAVPTAAALALLLSACGGTDGGTGKLSLALTDAPVDNATAVVVQFTGVEVQGEGGRHEYTFDAPRQIDLLALAGGGSELILDKVTLPAGHYEWLRLKVDATADNVFDSYITLDDGTQHELEVPSGSQTGLKLVSGFNVPAGGSASFTIDFDLRKSVHEPMAANSPYLLRPALRLVDNSDAGSIAGTVDASLITTGCTPAVYVFTGAGVTPDDVDGTDDPVTTAAVKTDGTYEAAFLAPGDYTVAFTCDAAADNPDTDDVLAFTGTQTVTVVANQATTANFP